MGQALYRKYRSKSLDELVGQEHITRTLGEAIKQGRISHAYLFTGPRGVGKTSTARILAHAINGLPYEDGTTHLDIIEIDAASNNSVEDIRDLREKVYVAPSTGKYKVYIIDEVHMLSKAAFNAILKTLEEPPAHAVFILATTEAHKLPETIISRTQRFVFRPINPEQAVKHLRTIADTEKIDISDEALETLAAHGDGSFRDSISLLDQASNLGKKIGIADVQQLLGMPSDQAISELVQDITATPVAVAAALQSLYGLYEQGFQAGAIAHELSSQLRHAVINGTVAPLPHVMQLMGQLLDVPTRRDPERFLEIVLLSLGSSSATSSTTAKEATPETIVAPVKAKQPPEAEKAVQNHPEKPAKHHPAETEQESAKVAETAKVTEITETKPTTKANPSVHAVDETLWPKVLDELKKQYNTLYGIVRMATVVFTAEDEIELRFAFAFHQKRVNETKNRDIISKCIEHVSGHKVSITCVYDPDLKSSNKPKAADLPPLPATSNSAEPLAAISNIFGGGELLQS